MDETAQAYLQDAQFHLIELRSRVIDGLAGKSDTFLRVGLLSEIDKAEESLGKALL